MPSVKQFPSIYRDDEDKRVQVLGPVNPFIKGVPVPPQLSGLFELLCAWTPPAQGQ